MAQPTPLEPTLYSLLLPSSRPALIAHLSLLAIHAEPLRIEDRIYRTINGVVPGQLRNLRLRSWWVGAVAGGSSGKDKGKGKVKEEEVEGKEGQWVRTLSYVSAPLRSAEYSEASVRAVLGVEVQGMSSLEEIEAFIDTLGFRHSHTYTLNGTLLHFPVHYPANPPLTLHLSIAHLTPSASPGTTSPPPPPSPSSSQPYFVQLHPSRSVYAVPHPGDIGLQSVIALMRSVAGQVDGLEWSTGSAL
ncbi:hypothetical protein IAT38_003225 [Cryptococcus sp. DSM 104549]